MAEQLALEWSRFPCWRLEVIGSGPHPPAPGVEYHQVGPGADSLDNTDLTHLSEWSYARFCCRFSREVTSLVGNRAGLSGDGENPVLVVNDISEGPGFRRLAGSGVSIVTIFHVDVVDYFCRIYLGGHVSPAAAARWYDRICRAGREGFVPRILRLVFGQQRDAVECSRALVVPSSGMARVLLDCYPGLDASKVHVIPWGSWDDAADPAAVEQAHAAYAALADHRPCFLTLSRISPEKGIDTLLQAMLLRERRRETPVTLLIAGAAAYMRGESYLRRLQRMASRLRQSRVHFVGHTGPAQKKALFQVADWYVMPSRHESYGLTLAEAIAAGLPAISTDHYSARDLIADPRWIVPREDPAALADALNAACTAVEQGKEARALIRPPLSFVVAAARLAEVVGAMAM